MTAASGFFTCGDGVAWIDVDLSIPAGQDPFKGVAAVRLTVTGPSPMEPLSTEVPYARGSQIQVAPVSLGKDRVITVEGLDQDRVPISRGQSAPFDVAATSPQRVVVPFAQCTARIYRDADADRFGDPGTETVGCAEATGYVKDGTDCNDQDGDVRPDQRKFFTVIAENGKGYDYNCDGREEREVDGAVDCAAAAPGCKPSSGWKGSVPACGQPGVLVKCEKKGNDCLESAGESKTQACR
jgi:hypothetical protein